MAFGRRLKRTEDYTKDTPLGKDEHRIFQAWEGGNIRLKFFSYLRDGDMMLLIISVHLQDILKNGEGGTRAHYPKADSPLKMRFELK
jgi:hypothetical protein